MGKECVGPPAHMAALKRAGWQKKGFLILFFLFVLNTCHFYRPVNEPNEIKHIKKLRSVIVFITKRTAAPGEKLFKTKRLQKRQEIAA